MSGGHTPGEWQAVDGAFSGEHILILADDYAIAKVYVQEEGSEETNRANARLIAAAPDLLAALEGLIETVEAQYRHGIRWDPAQVDAARAAIARTKTGEGK